MNTADEYKRAQMIMDDADEETADLIEDLWNELLRREKEEKDYSRIIDYWKIRCEAAEERLQRALQAAEVEENLSAGEEKVKQRILDAITSHIREYSDPKIDVVDTVFTAIHDRYLNLPIKIKDLVDAIDPEAFADKLIMRGWVPNERLSKNFKSPTTVLESAGGTRINIPLDKEKEDYHKRMFRAFDQYAKSLHEESPYL